MARIEFFAIILFSTISLEGIFIALNLFFKRKHEFFSKKLLISATFGSAFSPECLCTDQFEYVIGSTVSSVAIGLIILILASIFVFIINLLRK